MQRTKADMESRSLSAVQQEELKRTVQRMGDIRKEQRGASGSRRVALDADILRMNDRCETIIGTRG